MMAKAWVCIEKANLKNYDWRFNQTTQQKPNP